MWYFCYINRAFLHRAFSEKMLPDSSFPYMIKLDEAGGLAVVSSLFVCRYERRYAAGEGSFPRKAEVLRRRAVMCFNQLYQQKTIHKGNIRDRICNKKSSVPAGSHCFLLSYVFKLLLFFKVWKLSFEFFWCFWRDMLTAGWIMHLLFSFAGSISPKSRAQRRLLRKEYMSR